mmetsp:Transcript_8638/g.15619  ORF Transcript_8638/g.15619 Transcript_8638/m.15619 type:complete len:149 (+) Transcript_8638:66-512(+)
MRSAGQFWLYSGNENHIIGDVLPSISSEVFDSRDMCGVINHYLCLWYFSSKGAFFVFDPVGNGLEVTTMLCCSEKFKSLKQWTTLGHFYSYDNRACDTSTDRFWRFFCLSFYFDRVEMEWERLSLFVSTLKLIRTSKFLGDGLNILRR